MHSLEALATFLGLEFSGDGQRTISGLASLAAAGPADLSFIAQSKYLAQLSTTRAAAVIVSADLMSQCPVDCLISDSPYLAFARASHLFDRTPIPATGIHPAAVVSELAQVDASASVGPQAVIEAGAFIGPQAVLGAGVFVGQNTHVGEGTRVYPNAVIYHDVHIGDRCVIHAQSVIGADGFGFAPSSDGWVKIAQLGGVQIGNNVEIGANTTVDRGALDDTVLADGVIIDNLVQIAHNCRIGKNTAIAGCVGLAGSTIIGANCTLAGGVGVVGHVEICDNVHITGMTMVTKSITEPGSYSSGTPMSSTSQWKRRAVRFSQLESIQQRLAELERQR